MLRSVLIVVVLAHAFQTQAAEKNKFLPELLVQGEYRRDTLDYDDVEKQFAREKISLLFSKKSSLDFTHVYIDSTKENRFTWNIAVRDISPHFSCILGNYYINFGAGLLVGKKIGISSDLFSRKIIVSRNSVFMPCNSGNPLFCFQGIAAIASYSFTDVTVSLSSFVSIKNRYANNKIYEAEKTELSFNSIIYRSNKDYLHTEPVEVNDYGCAADIRLGDHILLQTYFIYSDIRRNNKSILWNYGDRGTMACGDKAFYGYGLFAQYRDEYITIFFESGVPNRVVRNSDGKHENVRDYGLVYGIKFRHPVFSLSLTGKNTGKTFYSPYSSGNGSAENAWMANMSVTPLKKLTVGAGFFGERNISPAYNESYLRSIRLEKAYLQYRLQTRGRVLLKFIRLESVKQSGIERYLQLVSSIKYYINDSVLLSLSGKAQKKDSGICSASVNTGIGFTMWNYFTFMMYFSRYFISNKNYLYSTVVPNTDAITSGSFIKTSSNVLTGKVSVRYRDAVISVRYEHQFFEGRSIQHRVDLFGRCLL
jgi:hypothetical protein